MVEPSDGTFGSFLKSGGGIFLIAWTGLIILVSVFFMVVSIGLSIYAESNQYDGDSGFSSKETKTCTTGDDFDVREDDEAGFGTVSSEKETALSTIYFSGNGDMTTQEFTLEKGVARFTIKAEGGGGRVRFSLIDTFDAEMKELYFGDGTTEPFVRTISIPYYDYLRVDVEADGKWSVAIEQVEIREN